MLFGQKNVNVYIGNCRLILLLAIQIKRSTVGMSIVLFSIFCLGGFSFDCYIALHVLFIQNSHSFCFIIVILIITYHSISISPTFHENTNSVVSC